MGKMTKIVTFVENSKTIVVDQFRNDRLLVTNEYRCCSTKNFGSTVKIIFEGFSIKSVNSNVVTLIEEIE